jgi:hypothetical protein
MTALEDIAAERQRQVDAEGWTTEHDDNHVSGEMACAALCYVQNAQSRNGKPASPLRGIPGFWPWDDQWWKPTTPRRDLVKAAALIVAEIERLDRSAELRDAT